MPNLSSMVTRLFPYALLLAAPAASMADPMQLVPNQPTAPAPAMVNDPLAPAIAQWNVLRQSDIMPFETYANFLVVHPGWPGEPGLRKAAERALQPGQSAPRQIVAYFDKFPPLTNQGQARYAEALQAAGRTSDAAAAARKAWTSGSLSPQDEELVLSRFAGNFTQADQDERMDRLLWAGKTSAAASQLPLTSPARRALFDARLAMRTNAPDASLKAAAVEAESRNDAGFIADKAFWLRSSMQIPAMRALLGVEHHLTGRPSEVESWYELLLSTARSAAADKQWVLAYNIARQVDDAYPEGTQVRDRPLGERDDYTSLVWLAGTTALNELNRPAEAIALFERYANAAQSAQTRAKGHYWAGRAAVAAGRVADANTFFELAARHPDQFYGQLALERLGRTIPAPTTVDTDAITPAARLAFNNREIVRAARILGQQGDWQTQSLFLRAIAASVDTPADQALAVQLAQGIGRPDLAVMVGRAASSEGDSEYVRAGYPLVKMPEGQEAWTTIIHAIARQESQFDRAAISRAGARGLMQLMPATARETAAKIGMSYDAPALTSDTSYNIQLGSAYFQRLLERNGGSFPLAIAAYNAGQGNVNKWLAAYGDPRLPGGDMVKWIESIPFSETRGYVQHVLENAVVYDTIHPDKARMRGDALLSAYLGKQSRG